MNSAKRSTHGGAIFLSLWLVFFNSYKGYCASWSDTVMAAQEACKSGKLAQAEKLYSDALKLAEPFGAGDPRLLTSIRDLADFYVTHKQYEKAEPLYLREAKMYQSLEYGSDEQLYDWMKLAYISQQKGSLTAAEKYYREALQLTEKAYGADSENVAEILSPLAYNCYQNKKLSEAAALAMRAISIKKKRVPRALADGNDFIVLVAALDDEGKYVEGERYLREVMAIQLLCHKRDDIEVLRTKGYLASNLSSQHKFDQADLLFEEVIKATREKCGANSLAMSRILNGRGDRFMDEKRYSEGINLYKEELKIEMRLPGGSGSEAVGTVEKIAQAYKKEGDDKGAKDICDSFLIRLKASPSISKTKIEGIESKLARYR